MKIRIPHTIAQCMGHFLSTGAMSDVDRPRAPHRCPARRRRRFLCRILRNALRLARRAAGRVDVFAGHDHLSVHESRMSGMTSAQQKDLLTDRWRKLVEPQKEVTSLHIPLVSMLRWCVRPDVIWRHYPPASTEIRGPRPSSRPWGCCAGSADLEFFYRNVCRKCRCVLFPRTETAAPQAQRGARRVLRWR